MFILLLVFCFLIRRYWISLCVQCSYSVLFGSSPCWLDHCVSTPCDSISVAVPRWISRFFALLARSLRFNTFDSITAAVLITIWLDHCVSTPCDSITAVFPRLIFRFFALLARSLRFNAIVLIQCSLVLRPSGWITAFQHHVTRTLRRFHVGSPGSSPCWLDHCVSTPCDSITAAVSRWI